MEIVPRGLCHRRPRRVRTRALAVGVGLALFPATVLTAGLTAAPAAAATPVCASGVPGDVNGDGHAEVAVGEPGHALSAGAVHVFSGTTAGLVADAAGTARNDQYLSQDTAGVPDDAEPDDVFGLSTALGDFDGDGCADLVVGAPGEDAGAGAITVFPGSPGGLTGTGAQTWDQDDLLRDGAALAGERFGEVLAVGDLNGDAIDDLVVGAPGQLIGGVGGVPGGGAVMILGSATGLAGSPGTTAPLSQASPGVPGVPEDGDRFGAALAIGDLDGNGYGDLVVGAPGENANTGTVVVLPGRQFTGAGGLPATTVGQGTPGVPDTPEPGDRFGAALAAGDATGDGIDDLAVGTPGEDGIGTEPASGAGAVTFLRGSAHGVTGAGSQHWTQASAGVDGVPASTDEFGFSLAMGPLDAGPLADLVVGAPRDAVGQVGEAGSVTLLLGGAEGLTTAGRGGARFHQDVAGVSGACEPGDAFGWSVSATRVQGPALDSLVVGVPGETISRARDGMLQQLSASAAGPEPVGSRALHLGTAGVQGTADGGDAFGSAVD